MAQLSKKTGPQAGAPAKAKAQAHTRCDLKHSPYTGGFEALAAPNACLMSNPRPISHCQVVRISILHRN